MKNAGILAIVLLLGAAATPARADIDQSCLRQCVNDNAGNKNACVGQCTYGVAAPSSAPAVPGSPGIADIGQLSAHNVVATPVPVGSAAAAAPPTPAAPPPRDYGCFNQCLQNHQLYDFCAEHCVESGQAGSAPGGISGVVPPPAAPSLPRAAPPFSPYPQKP